MRATGPTKIEAMPSATGGIARLVCARIRKSGIGLNPFLSKAGLTHSQIKDRQIRLRARSQVKLLEFAAVELRDDLLGFHLARDYDLREIGLLYYVLASSEIMTEALQRVERYSRIANEGVSLRLRTERETALSLRYMGLERQSDLQHIEFWMVSIVRLCRHLTSRRLIPVRIKFMHHRSKAPPELKAFFGCAIEYGAGVDEIVFSNAIRTLPVSSADPYLSDLLLRYCEDALHRRVLAGNTLRSRVEHAIAPLLPHGKATAAVVAGQMGLSRRTLARQLSSEGLSFSEVLTELKTDLAKRYLIDGDLPVSHVAWLVGYREMSAFTHAFKRWTGMSPSHWQDRQKYLDRSEIPERRKLKARRSRSRNWSRR